MKAIHYIILFTIIAIVLFIPYTIEVAYTGAMQKEDLAVEQKLLSSAESALYTIRNIRENVFDTEAERNEAIDAFFQTYEESFNYHGQAQREGSKYHVPVMVLVDWDGYYIVYVKSFKGNDQMIHMERECTDINTWTEQYGSYTVNYTLNTIVSVFYNGEKYSGNYDKVYEQLGMPRDLGFFNNLDTFSQERSMVVMNNMNEQLTYYVNMKNEFFNKMSATYQIMLPYSHQDRVGDLMDLPSVIAFDQEGQKLTWQSYTNIFAFCAADYLKGEIYAIEPDPVGGWVYHSADCVDATSHQIYATMDQCALIGAYPADCVLGE